MDIDTHTIQATAVMKKSHNITIGQVSVYAQQYG